MKTFLKVIGVILINLLLIVIAMRVDLHMHKLIRNTGFTRDLGGLYIPLFVIGFSIFYFIGTFRYAIGILAVLSATIIFMIPYLNRAFASKGELQDFQSKKYMGLAGLGIGT